MYNNISLEIGFLKNISRDPPHRLPATGYVYAYFMHILPLYMRNGRMETVDYINIGKWNLFRLISSDGIKKKTLLIFQLYTCYILFEIFHWYCDNALMFAIFTYINKYYNNYLIQ